LSSDRSGNKYKQFLWNCTVRKKPSEWLSIQHVPFLCLLSLHQWEESLHFYNMRGNGEGLWNLHQFWLALAIFWVLKICSPLLVCQQSGQLQVIEMTLHELFQSISVGQNTLHIHWHSTIYEKWFYIIPLSSLYPNILYMCCT